MSCDVRVKGSLRFASKRALADAVAAWSAAIDDDDACDSVVRREDLKIKGTTIEVDLDARCPATMWLETLAFLEELAQRAETGSLAGYLDGELDETIKATPKNGRVAMARNAKVKAKGKSTKSAKRLKPDPVALRVAAQFGELDKLEALLAAGTDPSSAAPSDPMQTTPLMMAAYHGKAAALARLIAAGAKLDLQDHKGSTALHYAVVNQSKRGRQKCIELLVDAGANTEVRELAVIGGFSPLQKAKDWGREGAAELEAILAARKPSGRD